jgi:hypothetical protein
VVKAEWGEREHRGSQRGLIEVARSGNGTEMLDVLRAGRGGWGQRDIDFGMRAASAPNTAS